MNIYILSHCLIWPLDGMKNEKENRVFRKNGEEDVLCFDVMRMLRATWAGWTATGCSEMCVGVYGWLDRWRYLWFLLINVLLSPPLQVPITDSESSSLYWPAVLLLISYHFPSYSCLYYYLICLHSRICAVIDSSGWGQSLSCQNEKYIFEPPLKFREAKCLWSAAGIFSFFGFKKIVKLYCNSFLSCPAPS